MDKIFEQALLYDFYGELLTPHQQNIYEDVVFRDMSLSEIAKEQGISRQGVHDLIKRCDKILQGYESKLHLVEKFSCAKEKICEIVELTKDIETEEAKLNRAHSEGVFSDMRIRRIRELSGELMEDW